MKFPISVIKVNDMIYLLQGKIDDPFIVKLNELRVLAERECEGTIRSCDGPQFIWNTVFINGKMSTQSYRIVSTPFRPEKFDLYQKIIKFYAEKMGYES